METGNGKLMQAKLIFFLSLYLLLCLPVYLFGTVSFTQAHAQIQTQIQAQIQEPQERLPTRQIEIRTHSANDSKLIARFKVEIADTPHTQRRGLMFRKKMKTDEGMLFIFPTPRVASFWMRNTILPLDMIFIKADGVIETIVTRLDIDSDKSTRSQSAVAYVLELNAGTAAAQGIKAGQKLHIHVPPQRKGGL